jgi:hypothetical protein
MLPTKLYATSKTQIKRQVWIHTQPAHAMTLICLLGSYAYSFACFTAPACLDIGLIWKVVPLIGGLFCYICFAPLLFVEKLELLLRSKNPTSKFYQ